MSDYLWPKLLVSNSELRLLMAIRYRIDGNPTGPIFNVKVIAWEVGPTSESEDPISVPSFYHHHLQRFLWRHHLFMELHRRVNPLKGFILPKGLRTLLQRYIQYMDGIVEGLLTTAKRNQGNAEFRSTLFNLYLITDAYLEGIHQPDLGDQWRQEHPETILETVSMDSMNWEGFYAAMDEEMPRWSGSAYDFHVENVPEDHWKDLAMIVGRLFGFPDPTPVTRVLGKRKCTVQEQEETIVESEDEPEGGPGTCMETKLAETSIVGAGIVPESAALADERNDNDSHVAKRARRSSEDPVDTPEVDGEMEVEVRPTSAGQTPSGSKDQDVPEQINQVMDNAKSPDIPSQDGSLPAIPDAPVTADIPAPSATDVAILPAGDLLDRAMGQPEESLPQLGIDVPELNFLDRAFMG